MLSEIFGNVAAMSAAGTAVGLLLLAAKPLTKRCFGAKWQYYSWLAVAALMLVPVFALAEPGGAADKEAVAVTQAAPKNCAAPLMCAELLHYAAYVWLIGTLLMLTVRIVNYARFSALISRCPDADISLPEKKIRVKSCDAVASPLLIGVVRPTLLIPCSITEENLKYILRHELVHYRRKDVLFKWVTMLVCSIHWFNPFVYVMALNIDEACEISCDEEATKGMSITEQKCYMNAVLELIESEKRKSCPLSAPMAKGKKLIIKRFAAVSAAQYIKRPVRVISVLTGAAIAASSVVAGGVFAENADIAAIPFDMKPQLIEPVTETNGAMAAKGTAEPSAADKAEVKADELPEYEEVPEQPEQMSENKTEQMQKSDLGGTVNEEQESGNSSGETAKREIKEYDLGGGPVESKEVPEKSGSSGSGNTDAAQPEEKAVGIGAERAAVREALGEPESVTYDGIKETYSMDDGSKVILHYDEEQVHSGYKIIGN